jgi:hypothetical protein
MAWKGNCGLPPLERLLSTYLSRVEREQTSRLVCVNTPKSYYVQNAVVKTLRQCTCSVWYSN